MQRVLIHLIWPAETCQAQIGNAQVQIVLYQNILWLDITMGNGILFRCRPLDFLINLKNNLIF